jgi:ribosomal protein S18 acetylase RimI-like enzyme
MNLQITKAKVEDIPEIQKIAYKTWPVTFGEILSQEQLEYMLNTMYSTESLTRQIKELKHIFLLANADGITGGFASYQINTSKITKLHKIYILPEMQGKQIGKSLLDEVIRIAKTENQTGLSLNVNRENKALNFYQRYGFKLISEEDIPIGNGYFMNDYVLKLNFSDLEA